MIELRPAQNSNPVLPFVAFRALSTKNISVSTYLWRVSLKVISISFPYLHMRSFRSALHSIYPVPLTSTPMPFEHGGEKSPKLHLKFARMCCREFRLVIPVC